MFAGSQDHWVCADASPDGDVESTGHAGQASRSVSFTKGYNFVVGVARFIDASIYRDTVPAIRIAILLFLITIFFV